MLGDPLTLLSTPRSQRFVSIDLHAPRIWMCSDAISMHFYVTMSTLLATSTQTATVVSN